MKISFRIIIALFLTSSLTFATSKNFSKPKLLFLTANGFNSWEFYQPFFSLSAAGFDIEVASPDSGRVKAGNIMPGDNDPVNDYKGQILKLNQVNTADYAGLIIGGGYGAERLSKYPEVYPIIQEIDKANKPIAAVCKGPLLLAKGGLLKGRPATCLWMMKDEFRAEWLDGLFGAYRDEATVTDGNIVTSRYELDNAAMMNAFLKQFEDLGIYNKPKTLTRILALNPGSNIMFKHAYSAGVLDPLGIEITLIVSGQLPNYQTVDVMSNFDLVVFLDGEKTDEFKTDKQFAGFVRAVKEATLPVFSYPATASILRKNKLKSTEAKGDFKTQFLQFINMAYNYGKPVAYKSEIQPIDQAIFIDNGFDDEVLHVLKFYTAYNNRTLKIFAKTKNPVCGKNGSFVDPDYTFADTTLIANNATIIYPGTIYPNLSYQGYDSGKDIYQIMKEASTYGTEMDNLIYGLWKNKNATVIATGFSALTLCNREEFKNKPVSTSEQAVWSFSKGGKFSKQIAVETDKKLITCRNADGLVEAFKILKTIKPEFNQNK